MTWWRTAADDGPGGGAVRSTKGSDRAQAASGSELDPDAQLQAPRRSLANQEVRLAETRAVQIGIDSVEVRMVDQVERFETELQFDSFSNLEVLEQRSVQAIEPRSLEQITAQLAE